MKAAKTWTPTKVPGLYRHISGTYYARVALAGKQTWRTLKTSVYEIAKAEHGKLNDDVEHKNELARQITLEEHLTGAGAILLREREIATDVGMKPSTRKYWGEIIVYFKKSWPEFLTTQLRHCTVEQCQAWAARVVVKISPTRYNNTVSLLKSLFKIAIKRGARRTNPVDELKRMKIRFKDLSNTLPNRSKFAEFVLAIRNAGGRFSKDCADFVEYLAYTGNRIGEASWVKWCNCEFRKGEILIEGDPQNGTKNSDQRWIPMIPAARALLERMRAERKDEPSSAFVLKVNEAQKAMDRAAQEVGMERITHHDLRHFFATICIESGVDIPTVAKWMGHKDGGALAMKVYGHLRNEHSLAAASRVSFAA